MGNELEKNYRRVRLVVYGTCHSESDHPPGDLEIRLELTMNGYLYILKSEKNNWHYVGSTKDLKKRIKRHNSGEVKSTKHFRPLKLVYYEAYI